MDTMFMNSRNRKISDPLYDPLCCINDMLHCQILVSNIHGKI